MRSLVILLLALVHVIAVPTTAMAQGYSASRVVSVERWVEEWDEASQSWIRVSEPELTVTPNEARAERYALPTKPAAAQFQPYGAQQSATQFGPFRVLDDKRAALMGTTDSFSPGHFDALLRANPELETLELVEAPGTRDDIANLKLGRMIRAAGITTRVPKAGSVRSGAVELFLAGAKRELEEGAEFAVHSWKDSYGREPEDFAADAPENRLYLDYYEEMGMSEERAQEFYAMTNSVPHHSALWLDASDMRGWIAPTARQIDTTPRIDGPRLAYLDVSAIDVMNGAPDAVMIETEGKAEIRLARLDLAVAFP